MQSNAEHATAQPFLSLLVAGDPAARISSADLGVSLVTLEAPPRPGAYREPPHLQLEPVKERMRAIFHVSPDSGLPSVQRVHSARQLAHDGDDV